MFDFLEKEINTINSVNYTLAKTLSMFEWQGLPSTIPKRELERLLQINGFAFITEVKGELYALTGGLGGASDVYGLPTQIIINNPALKFNKTLSLKDDGVLIINDDANMGLMPLIEKYNLMLTENEISMILYSYATRSKTLISASDDATKESAEKYLSDIIKGKVGIIGENAIFDGVKVQPSHNGQGAAVNHLTQYHQFIKALLYNELGIPVTNNMKKERLINAEVEQESLGIYPLVYNMMDVRESAAKALNDKFGLNISVGFGSVWRDNLKYLVDDVIEPDAENASDLGQTGANDTNEADDTKAADGATMGQTGANDTNEADDTKSSEKQLLLEMLAEKDLTDDDIKALTELLREMGE